MTFMSCLNLKNWMEMDIAMTLKMETLLLEYTTVACHMKKLERFANWTMDALLILILWIT